MLWFALTREQAENDDGSTREAASEGVLPEGAAAPAVRLPATDGTIVDRAELRGRRDVLLYFYEHAG